jgi:hypothetical protein
MNQDLLYQTIFKHEFNSLEANGILQQVAAEYPLFTPAQYFLYKKNTADKTQASVTALLFNNPLWLNWQVKIGARLERNESGIAVEVDMGNKEWQNSEKQVDASSETITIIDEPNTLSENSSLNSPDVPMEGKDGTGTFNPVDKKIAAPFEIAAREEPVLFEPLFATDYFASQGIKLSEEIKPDDKLGLQLKSFTEWLKSMKKVYPARQPEEAGLVDIAIQSQAEKSNTEDEILTETMAEVLAQQGKISKAIEVYQKLSLLNPSKSAYFAAKIESIS